MATVDWSQIFHNWGIKSVAPTDKNKQAYVLSSEQLAAVLGAGIAPSLERPAKPFEVLTPLDACKQSVKGSFYFAKRSTNANRDPEPRMGRELIRAWLQLNDSVLIGNIGQTLYAIKLDSVADMTTEEITQEIARRSPPLLVLTLALKAKAKPTSKVVKKNEFARNPHVVGAAIHRAQNTCEMPDCTAKLFQRDDGSSYLEVHHVVPLSEKGLDSLDNVAALCPNCHRQQHHSRDRIKLRRKLKNHIEFIHEPWIRLLLNKK
ncbi:HNH endonuclease signature motif containing protein [Pseudomonas sp. KK4]|uniref:HNH endonuclease n=1 Tax=Pseudomonas sp. KK4 TaxID=1855729 RepID=UPI00097C177F|nr:HNH endonuclease signature motif containing protein [Pseudomonas sp. KK4]